MLATPTRVALGGHLVTVHGPRVTEVQRHRSCRRASHRLWNRWLATPTHSSDGEVSPEEAASIAAAEVVMDASVDVTRLFSLRENAIAKEPGLGYPERWRCVSRLGASMVVETPSSLPRM